MKRFVAGLIAAILLVSCISLIDGGGSGTRTDGLYYQVSGIHPDATIMTVNGEKISAEEYLYWLAYDCEYLSAYAGSLDWNEVVTGTMTYADYVKDEVTDTMKTYAIVRQMAKKGHVTLSDEDLAALDTQRRQYIEYYGGEEAYLQQIQLLGVSEETFDNINSMYYLYSRVQEAFCDGSLRPGDEELQSFAEENGLMTAKLLYLSTEGLSEDEIAQRRDLARGYAEKLKEADDVDALYARFAEELGLAMSENGQTFSASETGEGGEEDLLLANAVAALDEGGVSDLIESGNGFYVAVRQALDLSAVADRMFSQTIESALAEAKVKYNDAVYGKVDVGSFYADLLQARQNLAATFNTENPAKDDG